MSAVRITSEIGPLEAVLVHTPGRELMGVTPKTREDYLYDDIIDQEIAHREHKLMLAVLDRFCQVYEVLDLLEEVVQRQDVREYLIQKTMDVVPSDQLAQRLMRLDPRDMIEVMVEGARALPGPLAEALNEESYTLPPLPNMFFTRDVGIVIGENAVIGSMRHGVRWTEEMLVKVLFEFHPLLANRGILYDGSEERRLDYTIEGGDIHPVRSDLVIVGFSDRSSPAAIDHLCDVLFDRTEVENVIVVVMPKRPEAIHLDMIFTQVDRELCVVYPPHFIGPERLPVLLRRKGKNRVREMPNFFRALREMDLRLEPVLCGGRERASQEREQWASGCNLVTVRPGVALAYARNEATLGELERHGFEIVEGGKFLTGERDIDAEQRAVITFIGSELVRGGGGPRCMTLPLRRQDL